MKDKLWIMACAMMFVAASVSAQSTNDFLISGGLDLIKTDNNKLFEKAQVGLEVNYFLQRRFSVGAGGEFWSQGRNSFVMGVRWYPADNIFLRFRGLIGINDAALGAGYVKALDKNFRLEGMADLYFAKPDFAIRAGVSYVINYVTKK